jgi:hypothetical protein
VPVVFRTDHVFVVTLYFCTVLILTIDDSRVPPPKTIY